MPGRGIILAAMCTIIAACASSSMRPGSPGAASSTAGNEGQAAAGGIVADRIERRRGEYPEIETDATGFTITEQVRISGEVRGEYQAALQLLEQDRYEQGIEMLVAVTEQAPDVTAPYVDLGIAYSRAGDLENAQAALEMASRLSPGHPIAHNELGIVYRKTGRFADARTSYEQALDTYPGFHYARRNLGVLCDLYLADLQCAFEHYDAYLKSVNEDPEVEIWIADVRNRLASEEAGDGI